MSKATNAAKLHKLPVISRRPANQIGKSPKNGIMKGLFGENLPAIPTNRSKYDDKPMPPLPDPSPVRSARERSDDHFYIHPATPYRKTPVNLNRVKDRAATDPVIPKPLFASKEKVRNQPFEQKSEPNYDQGYDNGESFQKRPSAQPATAVPSKASAVLGFYPVSSNKAINEMPSSAPPSTTPPDPYRSPDERSSYSPSPPRQVQSTPVPTRPYVRGNAILTPTLTHSSRASSRQMGDTESDGGPVQGIITGDGLLSPTRTGGYGKIGGATYVDQIDMQRVDSQMGIIESAHSPAPTENSSCAHHHNDDYNVNLQQPSHETMRYTPSNYAGVWENDPHVGYSLPPFSPHPTQHQAHFMPPHSNIYTPNESCSTYSTKEGPSPAHLPPPHLDNQVGSERYSIHSPTAPASPDGICGGNSHPYSVAQPYDSWWMPDNLRGNSYISSNTFASGHTQSGASLSGSANPVRKNAYAAGPPYHQFGLQPPPLQAGLVHMEMTLHHHIENCFAGLTRLVTDKHDRTVNQVVLRLESLEERLERRSKKTEADLEEMKGDLEELKKEITSRYEESSQECLKGFNSVRELVRGVDYKMGSLEKKVDECSCTSRYQCANGELSGSRAEFDLSPRRPNQSPKHRRTESAQATFPAQESSPLRFPLGSHATSGTKKQSRSSGDGKSDYSSSQGRHSNSTSTSARSSNDRSVSRREFFADLVATRGQQPPPPDLSQHPAYNQSHSSSGCGRPLTPIPSLPSPPYWSSQNSKGGPSKCPTTLLSHKPSTRHLDWYQKAFA